MAHLIDNSFSMYELTEQELEEGSLLTITQRQVIQNQLAVCAEEQLGLELDVEHPHKYYQEHAYKRGQIEMFQYLLAQSEAVEEFRKEQAAGNT